MVAIRQRLLQGFSLVPKTVQPTGKAVDNRHEILHHFGFGTQGFGIHDDEITLMQVTQMDNEVQSKSGESILVRNNERANIISKNPVNDG